MWWGCFYGNALHLNADGLYLNLTDRPGQTFYSETVQRSSELFLSLTEDKKCPALLQKHWSATAQFSSQLVVLSKMLCENKQQKILAIEYSIVPVVFVVHFSDIELGFFPTGLWLNSNYECGLEPAKSYRACCSADVLKLCCMKMFISCSFLFMSLDVVASHLLLVWGRRWWQSK